MTERQDSIYLFIYFKIGSYIFGNGQDVRVKTLEGVYNYIYNWKWKVYIMYIFLLLKPRLKVLLTFLVHDLI